MNVFKAVTVLAFFFIFHTANSQDTIHWRKNHKLNWTDFKGKPYGTSQHRAVTSSGIVYSYALLDSGNYFSTASFFDKNKSWTKTVNDSSILNHEQGHFDITEIYARALLAAFQKLKQDKNLSEKKITALAEKIIAEKNAFQKNYDMETGFGINITAQKKWQLLIESALSK